MERLAPYGLVYAAQLTEGEGLVEEIRRERRVLELGAGALDAVGDDLRVIEGERDAVVAPEAGNREVVDRPEPDVGRVGARDRGFVVRGEPDVRDRHHSHAGVAIGRAVGAELLDVSERDRLAAPRDQHARFLLELAAGGAVEVVVGLDEPARERPAAAEGMTAALHEEYRKPPRAHGEEHHVDRDRDGRVAGRVVLLEEFGLVAHPSLVLAVSIRSNRPVGRRDPPPKRTFDRVPGACRCSEIGSSTPPSR